MPWQRDWNDPTTEIPGYNDRFPGYNPIEGTYIISDDKGWRAEVNRELFNSCSQHPYQSYTYFPTGLAMLARSSTGMAVETDDGFSVINCTVVRQYLRQLPQLSDSKIDRMLDPTDPQNIQLSVDLIIAIKAVVTMIDEPPTTDRNPSAEAEKNAVCLIGIAFWSFTEPFIRRDMSLSEQVRGLVKSIHIALAVFHRTGHQFMPPPMYLDMVLRSQHVNICIVHMKEDNNNEFIY